MSTLDGELNDTLALVNAARMAFGKDILTELPDSRPGASSDCLYYRALQAVGVGSVDGHGGMTCADERQAAYLASIWGTTYSGNKVQAPKQFASVISKFDNSGLSHYETSAKPHF